MEIGLPDKIKITLLECLPEILNPQRLLFLTFFQNNPKSRPFIYC